MWYPSCFYHLHKMWIQTPYSIALRLSELSMQLAHQDFKGFLRPFLYTTPTLCGERENLFENVFVPN